MNWLRSLFVGTIPRDIHDQIVGDLQAQLRDERDRSRRQMRTIIKMKVAGGSIPRVLTGAMPRREVSEVDARITAALDANPRTRKPGDLRNRNRSYAERELANDPMGLDRVLARLKSWGAVDNAPDNADDDDVIAVSNG